MQKTESGLNLLNQEQLKNLILNLLDKKDEKGLLVLGLPGVGKTEVMTKTIGHVGVSSLDLTEAARKQNPDEEIRRTLNKGVIQWNKVPTGRVVLDIPETIDYPSAVYIDDIGTDKIGHSYGNSTDPIEYSIQVLYNKNIRLFSTSNLNMTELITKYGPRIMSRLEEMCHVVVLEGEDFRKQSFNKGIEELINTPNKSKIDTL